MWFLEIFENFTQILTMSKNCWWCCWAYMGNSSISYFGVVGNVATAITHILACVYVFHNEILKNMKHTKACQKHKVGVCMLVVGFYGKRKKGKQVFAELFYSNYKTFKIAFYPGNFFKKILFGQGVKKLNSHMIHINSCHHEVLPLCALCGEYIKIHLSCSNLPKSISRMMKLLQANFCDGTCVSS